jgi:hypothetical protein
VTIVSDLSDHLDKIVPERRRPPAPFYTAGQTSFVE